MIYLLYYDTDYGAREEWNIFYTPVEAFRTKEERDDRKEFLKNATNDDGNPCMYLFKEADIEFTEKSDDTY